MSLKPLQSTELVQLSRQKTFMWARTLWHVAHKCHGVPLVPPVKVRIGCLRCATVSGLDASAAAIPGWRNRSLRCCERLPPPWLPLSMLRALEGKPRKAALFADVAR